MDLFAFMLELIMERLLPGLIQLLQTTAYWILPQQWYLLIILSNQYNQISDRHQIFANSSIHQSLALYGCTQPLLTLCFWIRFSFYFA